MTSNTFMKSPPVLSGNRLIFAALILAAANFLVVLDTTIANVSLSHIAGGLAISPNEGTYVITSYAVAEAITVPLTGWLAARFGTLRVFTSCMGLFGFFSFLCGFANSLGLLIVGRILQGLAGGPLMPLSQTLLMQIFPKEKQGTALGLWSMTTLVAPVLGPILGGSVCDNWGWSYIFYINIPIALICSMVAFRLLRSYESVVVKEKIDFIGLILLIVWVSALQFMLDKGKDYDWFESPFIWLLCLTALLGFVSFVIWELTHDKPIVNLRVFRHRGYLLSVITISLAFGAFFSSVVLTPLWLQQYMGYTSTWAGYTTASMGILSLLAAPFVAKFTQKYDLRIMVLCGILWLGVMTYVRSFNTTDMTHLQIAIPLLLQGLGIPFFFIPLTRLALISVDKSETASAAGLMNFTRTLAGAASTSIITSVWDDRINVFRTDLVGRIASPEQVSVLLGNTTAYGQQIAASVLDQMTQSQAVVLATNHIFTIVALTFSFAALTVCFAPKPSATESEPLPSH